MIIKRLVDMTDDQITKEARRRVVDYRAMKKRGDFDDVMDLLERMTHDRSHLRYDIQGAA